MDDTIDVESNIARFQHPAALVYAAALCHWYQVTTLNQSII